MTNTIFKVSYTKDNQFITEVFNTFAKAAGTASALNDITRQITVEFSNKDKGFSHSGCMYIYSKDNTRRVANQYMINQVTKLGKVS